MQDDLEVQRIHFNKIADKYYHSRQTINHLYFKKLLWTYFFKNKPEVSQMKIVLEPMCGFMDGSRLLFEQFGNVFDVTSFDYSENVVNESKKRFPSNKIFCQDITTFETTQRYDLIILIGGLHHVPAYAEKVVDKLSGFLNRGGHFILFEPTYANPFYYYIRNLIYKNNKIFEENTERAFNDLELMQYFKKSNLLVVDKMYVGLLSYILYYNPDAFPYLNIGNTKIVNFFFKIDSFFFRNRIGRFFSFATMIYLKKQ